MQISDSSFEHLHIKDTNVNRYNFSKMSVLKCLIITDCTHLSINSIESLSECQSLESMDLSNGSINHNNYFAWKKLVNIKELTLRNYDIQMHNDCNPFADMVSLKSLVLVNGNPANENRSLSKSNDPIALKGLTSLEVLIDKRNDVGMLFQLQDVLTQLTNLKVLDVTMNKIALDYPCHILNINLTKLVKLHINLTESLKRSIAKPRQGGNRLRIELKGIQNITMLKSIKLDIITVQSTFDFVMKLTNLENLDMYAPDLLHDMEYRKKERLGLMNKNRRSLGLLTNLRSLKIEGYELSVEEHEWPIFNYRHISNLTKLEVLHLHTNCDVDRGYFPNLISYLSNVPCHNSPRLIKLNQYDPLPNVTNDSFQIKDSVAINGIVNTLTYKLIKACDDLRDLDMLIESSKIKVEDINLMVPHYDDGASDFVTEPVNIHDINSEERLCIKQAVYYEMKKVGLTDVTIPLLGMLIIDMVHNENHVKMEIAISFKRQMSKTVRLAQNTDEYIMTTACASIEKIHCDNEMNTTILTNDNLNEMLRNSDDHRKFLTECGYMHIGSLFDLKYHGYETIGRIKINGVIHSNFKVGGFFMESITKSMWMRHGSVIQIRYDIESDDHTERYCTPLKATSIIPLI